MTQRPEKTQRPDKPKQFASPACQAQDADPAYMGYFDEAELLALLNELLEAEMAGARVTLASAREAGSGSIAGLMQAVHHDEAHWCAMLIRHIKQHGATPSDKVGAFYQKAMAIPDLNERVSFLNRGQGWVVRKLREAIPRVAEDELRSDFTDMLRSHEDNITRANEAVQAG